MGALAYRQVQYADTPTPRYAHLVRLHRVECSPPPRQVHQKLGRSEAGLKTGAQILQSFYDGGSPNAVDVTKWAPAEWREADAEHRADVSIPGRAENALLQAERGF